MSDNIYGKKVFFLNPPVVINEVFPVLADAEFEVYKVKDHQRLIKYLADFPNCFVFVYLDEGSDEKVWQNWIRSIKSNPKTASVIIGVVTLHADEAKKKFYIMDLDVSSIVTVSLGAAKTSTILLKMLEANEARGRRRYIRVNCPPESASFNFSVNGEILRGFIKDISSVGMAVYLKDERPIQKGMRIVDIQLQLKSIRISLNGVVMGQREDLETENIYLIMFEPKSISTGQKDKLHNYIYKTQQLLFDEHLATY